MKSVFLEEQQMEFACAHKFRLCKDFIKMQKLFLKKILVPVCKYQVFFFTNFLIHQGCLAVPKTHTFVHTYILHLAHWNNVNCVYFNNYLQTNTRSDFF